MLGMKLGDPHHIVMGMLTKYVNNQMSGDKIPTKTAEAIGSLLTGIRVSRLYRRDIAELTRNVISREYLRGILTDYKTI
ncbi:hypothetical protein FACS1894168_1460 [Deltaproteobacteria bacterium]|nr:hypothetical protein FACS1894168_1460 [Deltaproteobacteria bacterium]